MDGKKDKVGMLLSGSLAGVFAYSAVDTAMTGRLLVGGAHVAFAAAFAADALRQTGGRYAQAFEIAKHSLLTTATALTTTSLYQENRPVLAAVTTGITLVCGAITVHEIKKAVKDRTPL